MKMQNVKTYESFMAKAENPDPGVAGLNALTALRLAHWSTEGFAQHQAFGAAYDEMSLLLDKFMEAMSGNTGTKPEAGEDPISAVEAAVEAARNASDGKSNLLNIVDEMQASVDKLKYLLTLK